MCSLFEFVVAQAPNRMRGIMMGLMITAIGIGTLGNYTLLRYFSSSRQPVPAVQLLPGTITTLAVDTNSVCDSCQALQAEREGETHQHTGHSGGTL